jgi:hypothetical protein
LVLRSFSLCVVFWSDWFDIVWAKKNKMENKFDFFGFFVVFSFCEELAKVLVDGWILVA